MTKKIILLATLVSMCATGQVMSMEEQSNDLPYCFLVNSKKRVKAYHSGYSMDPEDVDDIYEMKVLEAAPLTEEAVILLTTKFAQAMETKKIMELPYTLNQSKLLARITPLTTQGKIKLFLEITAQPIDTEKEKSDHLLSLILNSNKEVEASYTEESVDSKEAIEMLAAKFALALQTKAIIEHSYTLDQKKLLARITPLNTEDDGMKLFIEIRKNK